MFDSGPLIIAFIASGLSLSTTILLPALGEIFAERSGILNLGLEGVMLTGAFACFAATYVTNSILVGLLIGVIAGGLVGLLMAFLSISLRANQIVCGIAINTLTFGIIAFLPQALYGTGAQPLIPVLTPLNVPFLSQIPIIGPILFEQTPLFYLMILLVFLTWVILSRTTYGLNITATGENPSFVDTIGLNVYKIRYVCVFLGGMLGGLGGASLALTFGRWIPNMTAGYGWIAIALVMCSARKPIGAFVIALLFGTSQSLQYWVQAFQIAVPIQLLVMLPYVLTIIALVVTVKRSPLPRYLTIPYERGKRER